MWSRGFSNFPGGRSDSEAIGFLADKADVPALFTRSFAFQESADVAAGNGSCPDAQDL
jgi:hypothetical protein